jgi:hypothetical protein
MVYREGVPPPDDADPHGDFAGELFLRLADQGRLVVDAERADRLIADLEGTMVLLAARLHVLRSWQRSPSSLDDVDPALADTVVDALFADQLAPGRLERAVRELPKYLAALRIARRESTDLEGA